MRRRDVLQLLGAAAVFRPQFALAQAPERMRRIGWVEGLRSSTRIWTAVAEHLQPLGWTRGSNMRADLHVPTSFDQLPLIAREVVQARPDLIVTNGAPSTLAVLEEAPTVPVLFFGIADPISNGIVSSLSRPTGNVTGFMSFEPSLAGKWLQLLREIDPQIRRVALLFDPETVPNQAAPFVREFEAVAASLSIKPLLAAVQEASEIEPVVAALAASPGGALLVLPDEFTLSVCTIITDLTERYGIPSIYGPPIAAATGGLITYGPTTEGLYRGLASYIDRLSQGALPRDLPIQAPTIYNLSVNLRTAKALGLTISPAILAQADQVIE